MYFTPAGIVTVLTVQRSKELFAIPKVSSLSVISPEQATPLMLPLPLTTQRSTYSTLFSTVTSLLQILNAPFPISIKLSGIVNVVSAEHP